jgi:hypothetical protein
MRAYRTSLLITILAAASLAAPAVEAQQSRAFVAPVRTASTDTTLKTRDAANASHRGGVDSTRTATKPASRVALPAVFVKGKPGSLEVVAIAIPQELARIDAVHFDVLAAPGVRLIGRTEGVLPKPAGRPSSIVVTIAAPTSALAGHTRVASAFVEALSGEPAFEIPIEMTVLDVHRVELSLIDQLVGARRGDFATIRYRAVNFGNVPDSVSLGVQLPDGWKLVGGAVPTIRLGVRAAVDGAVRMWIPPQTSPGTHLVHIVATSGGAVVSAGDVRVEVENPYAIASQTGPRLDVGSVVSNLQNGATNVAYVGSLEGKVADSVSISASGVLRNGNSAPTPTSDLALMRLGVLTLPPSMSLVAPWFRVSAGLTNGTTSELAGNFANGNGVSAGLSAGGWTLSGTDARPYQYGITPVPGASQGAVDQVRLDRQVDSGTVFVMASHLADPLDQHQLDAASLGAALGSASFGHLSSEVGYRRFADGEGLGWSGDFVKQTDGGAFTFRALHAPGGAEAFARATDEFASSGNQRLLSWLGVAGGAWHTSDPSNTLGASSSSGWNVGPTFVLQDLGANIAVQARGSSLDVTGEGGDFGDRETGVSTDIDIHRGVAFATSNVLVGGISRSVGAGSGTSLLENGMDVDARAAIGASGTAGSVQVNAGIQQYGGTAGMIPRQAMIGVRAEHVVIPIGSWWHAYAGAEIQRLTFSLGNPALSQRYSLTVPLGDWFQISAMAERNPFYTLGTDGHIGWLTGIRVDRSLILPRLVSPGETHVVYRDVNANGRQDRGEEGIAGIVVNCGERHVVTDSRGRFKCGASESFSIDARSIPIGWVAPSFGGAARAPADVGLTKMVAVHVMVDLVNIDTIRVPRSELSKLIVVARDGSNQPWLARDAGAGDFVFDALPPGEYTMDVDASEIQEPLTLADQVTFRVGAGETPVVRLPLRGRTMKVRVLPPTQSDGPSNDKNAPGAAKQSSSSRQSSKENR